VWFLQLRCNFAGWSNNGGWKENAHIITLKKPCKEAYQHFLPLITYQLKRMAGEFLECPFLPVRLKFKRVATLKERVLSVQKVKKCPVVVAQEGSGLWGITVTTPLLFDQNGRYLFK